MPAYSGKNGKVKVGSNYLADVTKWSAEHKANVATFGSSSSNGWKHAVSGVEELSGDLEAKLQTAISSPPIVVGAQIALELETGGNNLQLTGNAVVTSVSYDVDIDSGEPVGLKASFVSDGAWTYSAGT